MYISNIRALNLSYVQKGHRTSLNANLSLSSSLK
nr:MAG TPA: hypothetical protein [Caudoviricetes sp.]